MEKSPTRQYKMGKYTHVNCRQCRTTKTTNSHHVNPRGNSSERRYSDAHDCVELMRRESMPASKQEVSKASECSRRNESDVYSSDGQESCVNSAQESCMNCANFSCESRAGETFCAAGKDLAYRGKKSTKSMLARSRILAGDKQNGQRFLKRSTSCGNVRGSANDTCTSSGTDSECSEILESASCIAACQECSGRVNSLERHRGMGSMPNLMKGLKRNNNNGTIGLAGNNHLGLEVMLSLINGPMQSVIDSKDEKIRSLERVIERLECENKQIKEGQKPRDATKIFTLEKTLEGCVRQIEQLEEANKTAQEKVRLLEDLRKNDKECIDILRAQTTELEAKLTKSDERIREAEKDGKNQSLWLKQQYEKQIGELQSALRAKEAKLRDLGKVKSRVAKQKQDLENQRNTENELHAKMCEQVLELKRDLQLHQNRLNILEREKRSLEESLSQSENLQRQDQKSSYVLQMKIVELQEKLDLSYKKNEELEKQREMSEAKRQVLEEKLKKNTIKSPPKWQLNVERVSKEGLANLAEVDKSYSTKSNQDNNDMNNVLREKVVELQKKLYKGQQSMYEQAEGKVSNETHVQELTYCEAESCLHDKWEVKEQDCKAAGREIMDERVPVRDIPLKKTEIAFIGDKRRPSSDDSCSSSSGTSSRRGSAESPRSERRQLKVLKVRKVSKENISQFQQNAAYLTSAHRQTSLKDVRENPSGDKIPIGNNRQSAFRQVKGRKT